MNESWLFATASEDGHLESMVELLDRRSWRTRVELANVIFEYLEIFHNRQRRHSAFGMLTPVEFETRYKQSIVA
jgi:transposase InsO family protein